MEPMTRMKAGTRMPRTRVASIRTASAMVKPSALRKVMLDSAKAPNTATMIRAAPVMIPPVSPIPSATARVLSPWAR